MLRQRHRFFRSVLMGADTLIIAGAAILAYPIRFQTLRDVLPPPGVGTGPGHLANFTYANHAIPIMVVVPLTLVAMLITGLYRPRRDQRFHHEAAAVAKAVALGVLLTVTTLSLFQNVLFEGRHYSAWQFAVYTALAMVMLGSWRFVFRAALRRIRAQGLNQRHVAIVGTGRLGQIAYHTIRRNSWTGISPSYFISHHPVPVNEECLGLPVRGGLKDLEKVLDEESVSGVFLALPGKRVAQLPLLLSRLARYPVDVRVVPDMNPRFMPMNMTVNELDGMPILSMRESPLSGWGAVTKRVLDFVGGVVGVALFALPMLVIAILVRLSGPGPIIFRQERMSLNGTRFKIFKFRTMAHVDSEKQALRDRGLGTEAWTREGDVRITRVGQFLRRWSLDELPQLFNVLMGEMALVGPRPERPELIERFREDWRGYMLRQNVKSGMTGWAQVNGLRGNTSLRKRLQYDLFYIRNWSVRFDLRILLMTVVRGFAHGT